jgi:DNA polymerase III sliding clamp (beta) subunit (PCNA family)
MKASMTHKSLILLLQSLNALVDEAKVFVTGTGWTVSAVDPSHVCMCTIKVPAKAFTSYSASDEVMGFDLEKIVAAVKALPVVGPVELESQPKKNRLTLRCGKVTRHLQLLATEQMSDPKQPQVTLKATVHVPGQLLHQGLESAGQVSDAARLSFDGKVFRLEAEGDIESSHLEVPKDELPGKAECPNPVRSLFDTKHLTNILRPLSGTDDVTLQLDTDLPLHLVGEAEGIAFDFLLAPRIEGE